MINRRSITISAVNNALIHRRKKIILRNIDIEVARCLYKYNIIRTIVQSGNTYQLDINLLRNVRLKNKSTVATQQTMGPEQISKLKWDMSSNLYIFRTQYGLLDQYEVVACRTRGVLIFEIYCI